MGTFAAMEQVASRLNAAARARNLMEAFPRTIQFTLTGEGGESSRFYVVIKDGRMSVVAGTADTADLVVTGKPEALVRVARGEQDVSHPIARGDLVVAHGKVSEMTLFNRVLWAA